MQGAGGGRHGHTFEATRGVIGRLSVLLLDGFKEEEKANPAAPRRGKLRYDCAVVLLVRRSNDKIQGVLVLLRVLDGGMAHGTWHVARVGGTQHHAV